MFHCFKAEVFRSTNPSIEDFLSFYFLIDTVKHHRSKLGLSIWLISFTITFRQRDKLGDKDWEGHWAPASEWCNVCVHQLDYILKLEREPWELWYLLDTIGLWEDRAYFLKLTNTAGSNNKSNEETDIDFYVSQLSDSQKMFLNDLYRNDFVMFNYSKIHI